MWGSKKSTCRADVKVVEAVFFIDHKVNPSHSLYKEKVMKSDIKFDLKHGGDLVRTQRRFYIRFNLAHSGHPPHAYKGSYNRIDRDKSRKIQQLASKGIGSSATMRRWDFVMLHMVCCCYSIPLL